MGDRSYKHLWRGDEDSPGVECGFRAPRVCRVRICATRRLVLATLVLVFAVIYPYLDAADLCGDPGCPHFAQGHASPSVELPAGTLGAGAVLLAPAFVGRFRRRPASERRPEEIYLSPEPDPPRL